MTILFIRSSIFLGGNSGTFIYGFCLCKRKIFYISEVNKVLFIPILLLLCFLLNLFVGTANSFNSFNLPTPLYEKDVTLIFISLMLVLMLCLISLVIVSKENQGL